MNTFGRAGMTWLWRAIAGVTVIATVSCADDPRPQESNPEATGSEEYGDQSYSIKLFLTEDGKTRQVNIAPSTARGRFVERQQSATTVVDDSDEAIGQTSDPLTYTACEKTDAGEDCVAELTSNASTDLLLQLAVSSCKTALPSFGRLPGNSIQFPQPPWSDSDWYIFDDKGAEASNGSFLPNQWEGCDEMWVAKEYLLCAADRLAEAADAVQTTVWEYDWQLRHIVARIPPQAAKDRFIVRDLALNVLAHVARLEYTAPYFGSLVWSSKPDGTLPVCFDAYRGMANGSITTDIVSRTALEPGWGGVLRELIDGPGNETSGDVTIPAMGMNRLRLSAELMRAAGRLTRDLIDKSVAADLAGAEWQRAHAADPARGIQAMWGQEPENPEAYNSLEHALKILFGRTEIRRLEEDPTAPRPPIPGVEDLECNGVESWDLVDALGPGFSARWNDRAPATAGQSLAISTIAKSGIVVPGTQLTDVNAPNLRVAIEQTLLDQAPDWQAEAVSGVVESMSDADLLFGLERAFDLYRLLTDSPADTSTITAQAGLKLVASAGTHANIAALGGAVIEGGLPRDQLSTDVFARLGGAQAASQCGHTSVSLQDVGTQWQHQLQSPFVLANVFGKRLDDISQAVAALTVEGADELETSAANGAAEVRAWAGEAVVAHGWGDFSADSASGVCPATSLNGKEGFCTKECPCTQGEGACSADDECASGLVCLKNKGNWWGMRNSYGVCVHKTNCADWIAADSANNKPGHASFCTKCKCAAAKGDCGVDSDCAGSLKCTHDIGAKFGYSSATDVCLPSDYVHSSCPSRTATPTDDYCSSSCKCLPGQGDADSLSCHGNLKLVSDIGPEFGMDTDYDLCEPQHLSDTQTFVLSGIQPEDVGATTNEQLRSKLTLVFGKAWMAECVAGIRKTCPTDMSGATAIPGFNRFDLTSANTTIATTGFQGRPAPTLSTQLAFNPDADPNNAGNLWYVIAHADPAAARVEGRVLATLAKGSRGAAKMEIVSKYREELANEIFNLGGAPRSTQTCTSAGSTSLPSNYCLEGMKRDMFVPLANELTGSSETREDSWQHYLALAEQAAAEADDLGRQLIEAGKERERKKLEDHIFVYNREVMLQQRREAAQEQLAEMCGAFIDEDAVKIDANGELTVDESEAEIAACLGTNPVDLVFLGPDPFENVPTESTSQICDLRGCKSASGSYDPSAPQPRSQSEVQSYIRQIYCYGRGPDDEITPSEQKVLPSFCMKETISHAGLNIIDAPSAISTGTCEEIVDVAEAASERSAYSTTIDGAKLTDATSEGWASAAGISASLNRLRYAHTVDGGWGVTLYGLPILGNKAWLDTHYGPSNATYSTVFPACRDESGGCSCVVGQELGCTVKALQAMFTGPGITGWTDEEIRVNVERALWHMGALAGAVPSGVFQQPLPAARLAPDESSLAPAIYSYGGFQPDTLDVDSYILSESLPDAPLAARAWLPPAAKMPVSFATRMRDNARKPWLDELYTQAAARLSSDSSSYLTFPASNALIPFNSEFWSFRSFVNGKGDRLTRDSLAIWLQALAREVDGKSCQEVEEVQQPVAALSSFSPTNFWPYDVTCEDADGFCPNSPQHRVRTFAREVCGGSGAAQQEATRVIVETDPTAGRLFLRGAGHNISNIGKDAQLAFLANDALSEPDAPCPTTQVNMDCASDRITPGPYCWYNDIDTRAGCFTFGPIFYNSDEAYVGFDDWVNAPEVIPTISTGAWEPVGECQGEGLHDIPRECLFRASMYGVFISHGDDQELEGIEHQRFAGRQLRPDVCRADQRVELFVDRTVRNDCEATQAITQALALSCVAAKAPGKGPLTPPPQVTTLSELKQFEAWLAQYRDLMARAGVAIHLQSVPSQAIADFQAETLSTAPVGKGNHGNLMLALQTSLLGMGNAWTNIGLGLSQIQDSLAETRARLELNHLEYLAALGGLDMQRIELNRKDALRAIAESARQMDMIMGAANFGVSAATQDYLGALKGLMSLAVTDLADYAGQASDVEAAYDGQIRSELDKLARNSADQEALNNLLTLLGFSKDAKGEFKNINDSLYQLKLNVLSALQTLNLMEQNREKAKWQLAKVAGAGFVEFDGQVTSQEINNVLARQYDGVRIRYERALERAKRAAYLARLAMEQRLGVRFASMGEPVGPLRQAPAIWIDDVCTLQGVDYDALKASFGPENSDGTPADPVVDEITTQFADAFIGDYVAQLRELMEFYLIEHPFQEADDVAVLSLKEDLLNGNVACTRNSINELFHSHALYEGGSILEDFTSLEGWRVNRCSGLDCIEVQSGAALDAALVSAGATAGLQPPDGMGGISWIKPYTATTPVPVADGDDSVERTVYQSVNLAAGQEYVLSWWDMARAANGAAPGAELAQYAASIYDAEWNLVGGETLSAANPGSEGAWSDRREVTFFTAAEGVYHVGFRLNSTTASVAIGNVQLERAVSPGAGASYYDAVEEHRLERNEQCNEVEDLSRFFTYKCEHNGVSESCFWELNKLIRLDTEALNQGVGPLVGKVGVGNYNHRLLSTMLNVVGSGVLDCSKDPRDSCYGSAYLEYDMDHASFNVPIDDYEGHVRCFDFGNGTIRGAKALASERYITMPVSSADMELISQPSFTKPEFSGRPLSGQYRLRVKDHPALNWANVDDIQMIMSYRYWSRVGVEEN